MFRGKNWEADRRAYKPRRQPVFYVVAVAILLISAGAFAYRRFAPTPVERAVSQLRFDASVSEAEQQAIRQAIQDQSKTYDGTVNVSVKTATELDNISAVLSVYAPVTSAYAVRQSVTSEELSDLPVYVAAGTSEQVRAAIAGQFGISADKLTELSRPIKDIKDTDIVFIPADQIDYQIKLLSLDGAYYLDSFNKGAVFRQAVYGGEGAAGLVDLKLNKLLEKEAVLKVNMTGVTALTRVMMRKLSSVKDAAYFSQKIGGFLADADITHVSNEVSFKPGCQYHNSSFCSPPEMIDALKASGVDLVELTGNHNNDAGSEYNTQTINLYHQLGWNTFGGGFNAAEAAKPYIADLKQTKVAFFGYNYADSPGSGAIAGTDRAGANGFDFDKVKADIAAAKQQSDFVIVDVQFWECYAYPDGYVEYPVCSMPIPNQKEVFRKIADLGADMVIGTQAHQPQTYELYGGKPIYYGLGNLYFDQTHWPGTERGIVLTHYFAGGKLLQTKLTPTVYHEELQTRLMTEGEAASLLESLKTARASAGL